MEGVMRKTVAILSFTLALVVGPSLFAQATRTWVSGVGDDANPCSRTAPCKTFAGAISKTAAGGEISVLDPGGFGAVNITKSITLNGAGTLASILFSGTNGIIVNGAGIIVNIKDISLNGGTPTSPGVNGIRIIQAASVNVIGCDIYNFSNAGIKDERNTAGATLLVKNTNIRNGIAFGGSTVTQGINIVPTSGTSQTVGVVDGCEISGFNLATSSGIFMNAGGDLIVTRTTFHGNLRGVLAGTNSEISLQNCEIIGNTHGVRASNLGTVRLAECLITGNTTNGVEIVAGGTVNTFQLTNRIAGNGGGNGAGMVGIAQQ
jgi:hypothetical protein